MATLTGFKVVDEGGRTNPVFVFDEPLANGDEQQPSSIVTDVYVDANEDLNTSNTNTNKSTNSTTTTTKSAPNQSSKRPDNESTTSSNSTSDASSSGTQKMRPDNSSISKEPMVTIELTPVGNSEAKSTDDEKSTTNAKRQRSYLSTGEHDNGTGDDDLSFMASCGKSPRQPRRSPLMALFRGQKHRESTRKTYTDEDAFEIEWARLHLAVHEKWYTKAINAFNSVQSMLRSSPPDGTASGQPVAKCGGDKAEMGGKISIDRAPVYSCDSRGRKLILNNVSGRVRSGEITAIMGPSGAGKTSLLHSLFGKHRSNVQGSIRVTGAPTKKHLTVCTIPQSESLIGHLTTYESLWFASRLKNTDRTFDHERNIRRVVDLLDLTSCQHTYINKCSGGQQKRVSIAQEMLSNPDILVLDEPTSGLDSLTCYRTVKVLRDLVEASKAHNLVNPMAIVLTIHQPHQEVLQLFHSVIIMAVGGACLYQGAPNEMEATIRTHAGPTCQIADGYNAASYMVEIASEEYGREPVTALVKHQQQRFERDQQALMSQGTPTSTPPTDGKHNHYASNHNHNQNHRNNNQAETIDSRIMTPNSSKNSDGVFWYHVKLMAKRAFVANGRDPLLFTIRIGAHIFIPLVVAFIYGSTMGVPNACPTYSPEVDLSSIFSGGHTFERMEMLQILVRKQFQNVGLHFMVYYAFGLCMLAFTAISFPLIMHVLIKEIRNGWYSLSAFILGKMIAELPMAIILPPISVGIIYVLTGQPSSYLQWRYLVQSLILILIIMIAEAKGLIFGALFMNSMQTAVFSASVSTVPFILLSGFLVRIDEVPQMLQGLSQLSYFRHSVEALIIARYGFNMCPCDPAVISCGAPIAIGIPKNVVSSVKFMMETNKLFGATDEGESTDTDSAPEETNIVGNNRTIERIIDATEELSPEILVGEQALVNARQVQHDQELEEYAALGPQFLDPVFREEYERKQQLECHQRLYNGKPLPERAALFDKMALMMTKASAFGRSVRSCEDIKPFTMRDMNLKDYQLAWRLLYLFIYIATLKLASYFIVDFCIKLKL